MRTLSESVRKYRETVLARAKPEANQAVPHWIASPFGFAMTEHNDGIKN
jgi:hypothetical protein